MSEILTIEQVTDMLSVGLSDEQWNANHEWAISMYNALKDGGILGVPNAKQIFIKKRWGFVELKL